MNTHTQTLNMRAVCSVCYGNLWYVLYFDILNVRKSATLSLNSKVYTG